jgi:pimeloyl-ACP methyl ester carboxylesterase
VITHHSNATSDTTHTVLSRDRATISYLSLGSGPAVLLIPGALSVAADYRRLASELAENYTIHIIERRGRGLSSPQGADYSMTKECEDVRAVQGQTGACLLIGHSFGGLIALEVARHNDTFEKIAVYEPGVSIDGSISMEWVPGYEQKLAEKNDFDAFVEFSRATGPDRARRVPHWLMKQLLRLFISADERRQMLGLLPENLREHQEVARLDSTYENYRAISAQVLLMYGGKSSSKWVDTAMEQLATVLPHASTREFPALDHFGLEKKGAREVAEAVSKYFRAP